MSNLGPQKQNSSYAGILQIPGGITSSLQTVTDGLGNATGLSISATAVSGISTIAQNLVGGSANRIVYQSAADTTGFLATGSSGQVLVSNGSGSAPGWSNVAVTASNNSGTPYTGAVSRAVSKMAGDQANVLDFGADPTGATNSNAAFQAAFNTGKLVYVPTGNYVISSALTTTGPGMIGDGQRGTYIYVDNSFTTGDVIRWNGAGGSGLHGPYFADFTMECFYGIRTSGALINITPTSDKIEYSCISNIHLSNGFQGLRLQNAWGFKVIGSNFTGATNTGIHVSSPFDVDGGDSSIAACHFGNSYCGVLQESSGGLKITNCKFLGGTYGYWLNAVLPTKNMADLLISNCSIESYTTAGIALNRQSGSYGIGAIVISGNQMGTPVDPVGAWCIIANDTDDFIVDITITGNTFGTTSGNQCVGLDYNEYLYVGANQFQATTDVNTSGLVISSHVDNCVIDSNQYQSFTPGNALICSSTNVRGSDWDQSGFVSGVMTSATWASFYVTGWQNVTFNEPFPTTPKVYATLNAGNGDLFSGLPMAVITNNITTTGFQWGIVGCAPSGNVAAQWHATLTDPAT